MKVSLIAAVARNGTIGRDNELPWTIKDDMRFFVEKTKGHVVICGRKNFDAMGRPLPHRRNVVISRNPNLRIEGAEVVPSLEQALLFAERLGEQEAFVIGGAEIYRLALPYAHVFYRTRVLADVAGNTKFPELDEAAWEVREVMRGEASERNDHPFVVEQLAAKQAPRDYHGAQPSAVRAQT